MHPADPIHLEGSSTGVLMLHGFTSTPAIFREIAARLHKELGHTIHAPLIAGHGTSPADLEKTDWHDWYQSVQEAFLELRRTTVRQYIVGASFGSNLACVLAAQYPVDGVVCIGYPRWIEKDLLARLGTPIYRKLGIRTFHKKRDPNLTDPDSLLSKDTYAYPEIPVKSVADFLEFIGHVTPRYLHRIEAPLLVIQSRKDGIVQPKSADYLISHIASEERYQFWVNEPHHRLHLGNDREAIYTAISEFFQGNDPCASSSPPTAAAP